MRLDIIGRKFNKSARVVEAAMLLNMYTAETNCSHLPGQCYGAGSRLKLDWLVGEKQLLRRLTWLPCTIFYLFQEFAKSPIYPVLIISYEMFLRSHDVLKGLHFDLLICDEGHRLKNGGAKTTSVSTFTIIEELRNVQSEVLATQCNMNSVVRYCWKHFWVQSLPWPSTHPNPTTMSLICEELYEQAAVDVVQPLPQGEPCCDSSEYHWIIQENGTKCRVLLLSRWSNNLLPIAVLASWPHQEQFT